MYQNDQQREEAKKARAEQLKKWKDYNEQVLSSVPEKVQSRNYFDLNILFLDALREGELAAAKDIYATSKSGTIDVNFANKSGLTGLHEAATNNDLPTLEYLIGLKADMERRDIEGWTPLHLAAQWEHMDATKYLVEHGANILALTDDLELARDVTDNDPIKKYLSDVMNSKGYGPEIIEDTKTKEYRDLERDVRKWIDEGRDIKDFPTDDGATPLHIAACKGYEILVRLLVEKGAVLDAYDNEGWTPLHAAVHWEQKECMKILIENGADVDQMTFRGELCNELTENEEIKKLFEELKSTRKIPRSTSDGLRPDSGVTRTRSVTRRNSQQRREMTKLDQQKEKESAEARSLRVASVRSSEKNNNSRKLLSDTFSPRDDLQETGTSHENFALLDKEPLTSSSKSEIAAKPSVMSAPSLKTIESETALRPKENERTEKKSSSCCVLM